MFSTVRPGQWVALRLPSDTIKVEQMTPNTTISLGKFGYFQTNHVINRPFHVTWEILERSVATPERQLRLVSAAELHADVSLDEIEADFTGSVDTDGDQDDAGTPSNDKSNVNIFDDNTSQKLSAEEIERLKNDGTSNPRELIAKIMESHSAIDQKTAFSLAKYIMRKQKKYMKRFTVLPLDVSTMTDWMMADRDFSKIMEIRNDTLGLVGSLANVHAAIALGLGGRSSNSTCRYLVVDGTGGLMVAAVAERMGILHHYPERSSQHTNEDEQDAGSGNEPEKDNATTNSKKRRSNRDRPLPTSNTIHMVHSNQQPNMAMLKYFNFDYFVPPSPSDPSPHPLHSHLKTLTWLQLLQPQHDSAYEEPALRTTEELQNMKTNARSNYYRKRRRWERCRSVVDETRAGGFDGLIIATFTNPLSILHHLVPLLSGGAQIVIYQPHAEPLVEICDAYSVARRTAFIGLDEEEREAQVGTKNFPVDPTLTLGFSLQTVRGRHWQVLPERTHPVMTSRGGAEGYVATATRVLPVKGRIHARGQSHKKPRRELTNGDSVSLLTNAAEDKNSSSSEEEEAGEKLDVKRVRVDDEPQDIEMMET